MMYKLWHRLFGWDYIYWSNGVSSGVSRVEKDGEGNLVYWKISSMQQDLTKITSPKDVVWLTCNPKKYFPEKVSDFTLSRLRKELEERRSWMNHARCILGEEAYVRLHRGVQREYYQDMGITLR